MKQAAELIPNQAMLINTLPLLEARASSEIENIVTTADELFRHVGNEAQANPATKEALRYSRALFEGFQAIKRKPLSTSTAEQVCTTIKGVEMSVRRTPGTTLVNDRTGATIYTYQFEAIHPFSDGNGRTGRVLNSLFLIQEGLLTLPILYLSRYIINNKADYYRLLLQVTREQDWESWLLYILKGVEQTASWTTGKIAAIRALSDQTAAHVRARLPKVYSHELVSLLFELPYCRIGSLTERGIAKRQTASVYLKQLVDIGVLQEQEVGKEKLFIHPKLMQLLTRDDNKVTAYK